ncbi:MAG: hypothetical protein V3W20_01855 [Candidatus Neomarinimicrobiota bacterium]
MKKLKIAGNIKMYVTDKNGKKRKLYDGKNSISSAFHQALAKHIDTNYDIALDNLFTGASPINGQDGIYLFSTNAGGTTFGGVVAMATVLTEPAAHQLVATGTYVNSAGSSVYFMLPILGKNYVIIVNPYGPNSGNFVDFNVAGGTSAVQTIPAGETFTVVWTITFTVH